MRSASLTCIRIGIREGIPHRGGVDWNDVEFVEEGIGLEEVDLILKHILKRDLALEGTHLLVQTVKKYQLLQQIILRFPCS